MTFFKSHKNKRRGFTLIELLVAISLISVLAITVITIFNPLTQLQKARDARRKSDLLQIQRSLELYYQDKGNYPASISFGTAWTPYMTKVPNDPENPNKRYFYYRPDPQYYYIYASLERGGKDPNACNSSGTLCASAVGVTLVTITCGSGTVCNYGVSSPNKTP